MQHIRRFHPTFTVSPQIVGTALGAQAGKQDNELTALHIIAGAGKQGSRSSLINDSASEEIFAVKANEVLHTARAEPFDTPAVRSESFDKAQDRLVEACGELRRTRNGWNAQDRPVEACPE